MPFFDYAIFLLIIQSQLLDYLEGASNQMKICLEVGRVNLNVKMSIREHARVLLGCIFGW